MRPVSRGEVYDTGYQPYDGPRDGRFRARQTVFKDGIRMALGIGRGGRAKILPWFFITIATIPAFVMALIAGTVDRIVPVAELGLPTHADYYGIASIILFIFAAVVGSELLCTDRRSGVIDLYFVRPLSGTDYVVARWAAFLTVLVFVAWTPQFVLLIGLTLGTSNPVGYLADNWLDIPRFLGAGFALALFLSTLALAVAAFTTRRAYASVFMVGLLVIGSILGAALSQSFDQNVGKWLTLINISFTPMFLNDIIFDKPVFGDEKDPSIWALTGGLPNVVKVFWYIAWTTGPGFILWRKYRNPVS